MNAAFRNGKEKYRNNHLLALLDHRGHGTIRQSGCGSENVDVVCLDLEGVLVPEIWIAFAEKTGIEALRATTRDIPDYDELMAGRLRHLAEHDLKLPDIQAVIAQLTPLPGAREFLEGLRESYQVIILSDTFYEFSQPLMRQLGWPTLFCHRLVVDAGGSVTGYKLRQQEAKRKSVLALRQLEFRVLAAGDSYNDIAMLEEADRGFLFRAPDNVINEFPQYVATNDYIELRELLDTAATSPGSPA
jgi:phosphoserine/homoserine phosphotransferase